ncbi:DivIVA domain-containing protein [Desulfovibrio litoralis]|uniref:DivIVA domain-containing protein n=1 Tax=Desulfovibrio litoralis DSM 11393 TaxID=1121455 RepID=A0A1M7TI44_9BACT|nr:DivIVA domain-containing protein [Desulfovibrio litoralis]SHN70397.1 DivIVA domain-containing protein [Desulfovibrio litoralis DSM 11393]
MAVSRIDILNHEFTRSLRGYNPEEVDNFLHDVADTLGRLADEKVVLSARVVQIEAKLAEFEQQEAALRNTLIATQRMTEDLKTSAQREAQLIIDAARARADNLLQQAHQRLGHIFDEISEAKKLKSQFEISLRSIIESHLRMLDMQKESEARLDAGVARLGLAQRYTPLNQRANYSSQQNQINDKNSDKSSENLQAQTIDDSDDNIENNTTQNNITENINTQSVNNQTPHNLQPQNNEVIPDNNIVKDNTTLNFNANSHEHERLKDLSPEHQEDLLILEKLQGPFELKIK